MPRSRGLKWLCEMSFISYFSLMIFFILCLFFKGYKVLSLDLITNDFNIQNISLDFEERAFSKSSYNNLGNQANFSVKYGFSLIEYKDFKQELRIKIDFINSKSPLYIKKEKIADLVLVSAIVRDDKNVIHCVYENNLTLFLQKLEQSEMILSLQFETIGGGIRGSIMTTVYLVILVSLFCVGISLLVSFAVSEYLKNHWLGDFFQRAVQIMTSIPSIIYGLFGVGWIALRVDQGREISLITAMIVLLLMIFPYLTQNFLTSIKRIESDFREQVVSLGVQKYQMIFFCLIPKIKKQIFFNIIYCATKVIGESAALFFILGLTIQDKIALTKPSTTLALHIYSLMSVDNPNYPLICAISIVLFILTFVLNSIIKIFCLEGRKK